jgi:transcriptional regulator GlxA family with amidase domain
VIHVSLLAIPEAGSSLLGAAELLSSVGIAWESVVTGETTRPLYKPVIVSETGQPLTGFNGWVVTPAAIAGVQATDVVFIPSLWLQPGKTFGDAHRALKDWIVARYRAGAIVCAACTGVQLLAETGLLNGQVATTHWAYAEGLRANFPRIDVQPDKVLVESGEDRRLITSGSHATWYDLLLYVISRTGGRQAALQTAKFFLLQWHTDGQSPYMAFRENLQHGDAAIRRAQEWLQANYSQPSPVTAVEALSGLPSRSFQRRFKQATGHSSLAYVQQLRIDRAKTHLEESELSVEAISWRVGYEDVAFFNRLFKRSTGLTPREYRQKFSIPAAYSRS